MSDQECKPTSAVFGGTPKPGQVWMSYSFARDWLRDATDAAQASDGNNSKRQEILLAVTFAESFLFEWVRDTVLSAQRLSWDKVEEYFPKDDRRGIAERWKTVAKQLAGDKLIAHIPNFGDQSWEEFRLVVDYRNAFVHAGASRPERPNAKDVGDISPSKGTLQQIAHGWARAAILAEALKLCEASKLPTPPWLPDERA